MKKALLISIIILFSSFSAFCGYFEDTLEKANQGNSDAQFVIGDFYNHGLGGEQNDKKAFEWYKKSAENGLSKAQFMLGSMYETGQGVDKDSKKAIYWYTKAADQGSYIYQYFLGEKYDFGGGDISKDFEKAIHWYSKAAAQGYDPAQFNLGSMYASGQGVAQDYKQAVYWYEKAAEQGNASAQFNLAMCFYGGQGVPQNFLYAYIWFSLAVSTEETPLRNAMKYNAEKKISPNYLIDAQQIAAQIQYKIDHPAESQKQEPAISDTEKKINSSGTGFFITRDGYFLTCHHVIKGATKIEIAVEGKTHTATLVRDDPNNDLALLKINGSFPAIAFSSNRSAKMGQQVFTIGYPNPSLQGVSAKFTEGTINSLTGFQDDIRLYQISIPVQPGNSGGALLDETGNVLGVVVAMLNAKTTFQISGALPQNVNYAVKSLYAQAMIDTLPDVVGKLPSPAKNKSDAISNAEKSTVMVICYD